MSLPIIDLPRNPADEKLLNAMNWRSKKLGTPSLPCAVCDRPISPSKQTHFVHIVEGGGRIAPEKYDGTINAAGDVGCHPVGPECRKLIPKGYVIRMDP